jgi:hypothetical protein
MKYNPEDSDHRRVLAATLVAMLTDAGFQEEGDSPSHLFTRERMFSRRIHDNVRVVVYTTIVGQEARGVGRDAIRVVALYTTLEGEDRGIAKGEKRVNRTGKVSAIVDRTLLRMRDVWKAAAHAERCHCGAPKAMSKAGNLYCLELCWKKVA